MRTISERTVRKLKKGIIPRVKLIIDGLDLSQYLVDITNLRIDRELEVAAGELKVQDLILYLLDKTGSIEAMLNVENKQMELKLVIDEEEITIFSGITLSDLLQREGMKLVVRCANYLKDIQNDTLDMYFPEAQNGLVISSIDKLLKRVFPDSTEIDLPLFSINSTKGILSVLLSSDGWTSENIPEISVEKSSVFIYYYDASGTFYVAISNKNCIEFWKIETWTPEGPRPSATLLHHVEITHPYGVVDRIRLLGYKNGNLHIAFKINDEDESCCTGAINTITFEFSVGTTINKWQTWYDPSTGQPGGTIGVDVSLESITFDSDEGKFYYATSKYYQGYSYIHLYSLGIGINQRIYRRYSASPTFTGSQLINCAWGVRYGTKFYYVAGNPWWSCKFVFNGSTWTFNSISNFGVTYWTRGLIASGDVYIIGQHGYAIKICNIETGNITQTDYRTTSKTTAIGYSDNALGCSNSAFIAGIQKTNETDYYIVKVTGTSITHLKVLDTNTPRFSTLILPVGIYDDYWYCVGIAKYTNEREVEVGTSFAGFYSANHRIPWFIIHPENVVKGTRTFVELIALHGAYLISYLSTTSVKAKKRIPSETPQIALTQNDYERIPETWYDRIIKTVVITGYYGEDDYWIGDISYQGARYRLDSENPYSLVSQTTFVGQWYLDNYGQPNAVFSLTTRNLLSIEELDTIQFTDHLGRTQTGIVVGTRYEYPHRYIVIVHCRTVETEANLPPLPPPVPSPPDWENVKITTRRLYQDVETQLRVQIKFTDVGGLPITKVRARILRYTSNGEIGEDIYEYYEVPILKPGSGAKYTAFIIGARFDEIIFGVIWGEDRLGRTTCSETFSISAVEFPEMPKVLEFTEEYTEGIFSNRNACFDFKDDNWTITGDYEWLYDWTDPMDQFHERWTLKLSQGAKIRSKTYPLRGYTSRTSSTFSIAVRVYAMLYEPHVHLLEIKLVVIDRSNVEHTTYIYVGPCFEIPQRFDGILTSSATSEIKEYYVEVENISGENVYLRGIGIFEPPHAIYSLTAGDSNTAIYSLDAGDSDTVDGHHASDFAPANHNHDSRYLRKDQSDTLQGSLTVSDDVISQKFIGQILTNEPEPSDGEILFYAYDVADYVYVKVAVNFGEGIKRYTITKWRKFGN